MAASNSNTKGKCFTCRKEKTAYQCSGCTKTFCLNHYTEHNVELEKQFHLLDGYRQNLDENLKDFRKHPLFEQINQWERRSIEIIQRTATETRNIVFNQLNEHFRRTEIDLNQISQQMKSIREKSEFNERTLADLDSQLKRLEEQLNRPENISVREDFSSSSFISKISAVYSSAPNARLMRTAAAAPVASAPRPNLTKLKWNPNAVITAGGNGQGSGSSQLSQPMSMCMDYAESIYIADQFNHRIIKWEKGAKKGVVVAGGLNAGDRTDQLSNPMIVIIDDDNDFLFIADRQNKRIVRWSCERNTLGETIISNISCRGLAMDQYGYIYASDEKKHEVKRWKIGEKQGSLVAGGNGKGDRLNQFNEPRYIFVDQDESVYVSDWGNHRVMKWTKGASEGIIVAGGQGEGDHLKQLSHPNGLYVDRQGSIYVVDTCNDRVMRWTKDARQGELIVGGNGRGNAPNQLYSPRDLCFDRQNNLYVLNNENQCVRKFSII